MHPLPNGIYRLLLLGSALLTGCTFHSTATHWNGRVGADGKPIYVKASTNVGLNVAVILPVLGNTSIDTMLDESSREIGAAGSDHLRVIETSAENYWYGFPPFTWILTPVITNVSVEYQPSPAELAAQAKADALLEEKAAARAQQDHGHVIPEARR